MEITIKSWADIPKKFYKEILSRNTYDDVRLPLFVQLLKYHGAKNLTNDQVIQLYDLVDWSFLDDAPQRALLPEYRAMVKTFKMPAEKLTDFRCFEFQLMHRYFNEIVQGNQENIRNLVVLILNIGKYTSQKQVEYARRINLPNYFINNILIYCESNLKWFHKLYTKALQSGSGNTYDDGLGWTSTFMTTAESGVFGNLESVYLSNIHDVMIFLVKKSKEAAHENNQSNSSTIHL